MSLIDWKAFPKTKPTSSGSYLCSLNIDPERHSMEDLSTVQLYWDKDNDRWIDYLSMKIIESLEDAMPVMMSKFKEFIDFTDGVVAWGDLPAPATEEEING